MPPFELSDIRLRFTHEIVLTPAGRLVDRNPWKPTFYPYLSLVPMYIQMQAFVSDVVTEFTSGIMIEACYWFLVSACSVKIPVDVIFELNDEPLDLALTHIDFDS